MDKFSEHQDLSASENFIKFTCSHVLLASINTIYKYFHARFREM